MKKLFTLNLDDFTKISPEESAKMIGGGGENASLWTPRIPIVTLDFSIQPNQFLNGFTAEKDKDGSITFGNTQTFGNVTVGGTIKGSNGNITEATGSISHTTGDFIVGGQVSTNGSSSVFGSYKNGPYSGKVTTNIDNKGKYSGNTGSVTYNNGTTSFNMEVTTNEHGSISGIVIGYSTKF